jgi:hypothetical protein
MWITHKPFMGVCPDRKKILSFAKYAPHAARLQLWRGTAWCVCVPPSIAARISGFRPPPTPETSAYSAQLILHRHLRNPASARQSPPPILKDASKPHSSPASAASASGFVQISLSQMPRRGTILASPGCTAPAQALVRSLRDRRHQLVADWILLACMAAGLERT